jgi:polyhydroxybutyrate depolymerase
MFLGTDDPLVPYKGGWIEAFVPFVKRGRVMGAEALQQFWAGNNGCSSGTELSSLPDLTGADDSTVTLLSAAGCRNGAAVDLYRIEGGGHTWPGGKQYLSPRLVGKTNRDISATQIIWRFFAAHPLP